MMLGSQPASLPTGRGSWQTASIDTTHCLQSTCVAENGAACQPATGYRTLLPTTTRRPSPVLRGGNVEGSRDRLADEGDRQEERTCRHVLEPNGKARARLVGRDPRDRWARGIGIRPDDATHMSPVRNDTARRGEGPRDGSAVRGKINAHTGFWNP